MSFPPLPVFMTQCHLDDHFKIGTNLKPELRMRNGCPSCHYFGNGKFSQWLFIVLEDGVQSLSGMKEFIGLLLQISVQEAVPKAPHPVDYAKRPYYQDYNKPKNNCHQTLSILMETTI